MGKLGLIFMIVGGVIMFLSLIYEFFYGGQEGINGVIIGAVGALIGVQLFSTNQIISTIRNLRIDLREDIREAREEIRKDVKEVRKDIVRVEERIEEGIKRVEERTNRILEKLS